MLAPRSSLLLRFPMPYSAYLISSEASKKIDYKYIIFDGHGKIDKLMPTECCSVIADTINQGLDTRYEIQWHETHVKYRRGPNPCYQLPVWSSEQIWFLKYTNQFPRQAGTVRYVEQLPCQQSSKRFYLNKETALHPHSILTYFKGRLPLKIICFNCFQTYMYVFRLGKSGLAERHLLSLKKSQKIIVRGIWLRMSFSKTYFFFKSLVSLKINRWTKLKWLPGPRPKGPLHKRLHAVDDN